MARLKTNRLGFIDTSEIIQVFPVPNAWPSGGPYWLVFRQPMFCKNIGNPEYSIKPEMLHFLDDREDCALLHEHLALPF